MTTDPGELSAADLRRIVLRLPERLPITDSYESRTGHPGRKVWYRSQKEHLTGWLAEYHTDGAYRRKTPGKTARFFYNHLCCVAGLIWLAEALGVSEQTLRAAVEAVKAAAPNASSQCAAFRRHVPWPALAVIIAERRGKTRISRVIHASFVSARQRG